MFSRKNIFGFAIRSVEVRTDFDGGFMVVYWSPVMRDYWTAENLSEAAAEKMALTIQTRLALEWGAPNVDN